MHDLLTNLSTFISQNMFHQNHTDKPCTRIQLITRKQAVAKLTFLSSPRMSFNISEIALAIFSLLNQRKDTILTKRKHVNNNAMK